MDELPATDPTVEQSLRQGLFIGTAKEVEVTSAVRLFDVLFVELAVATLMRACWRPPCLASTIELHRIDAKIQTPGVNIELDHVAVAHERERTANRRLGRHMQQSGAICSAAHSRVGNAEHVSNTSLEQLSR